MGSDEESYGDFMDDDDLEGTLNQASQTLPTARREGGRPTKKRRIIVESDEPMDDFISNDNTTSARRNAMVSKSTEFDSEDELSEPSSCAQQRRRNSMASTECSYDNESHEVEKEKAEKKKKQKQFIHVDNVPDIPATQVNYATQLPANMEDPDSSPSQIRGAKWIFKKPEMPKSPAARGLVSNAQTFRKGASSSSPATRIGRTSTVNTRKTISPGQRLAAFSDVVAPALQHEAQRNAAAGMIQQKISNLGGPSQIDLAHELEGLDYEDFASSPDMAPAIGSHLPTVMSIDDEDDDGVPSDLDDLEPRATQARQRLVAPQTGLRQTTLFGGQASSGEPRPSQARKVHNYRVDLPPEEPTHHELDQEALKTWVYPTNLGAIRDYQFTIVSNALFNNTLVALPTGLGKTFIAATVMLNFFRWTKKAQIVFMAPTKPLVAQQVDACFNIVGIPRSATTMLNGEVPAVLRREEWLEKRVFFMTPQTLENDLRNGLADPKNICLLVVDEAHRATGNYAYTKVISIIKNFNKTFRVLALTATPGSNVEAVQEVIDNLGISKVEIRTEDSIDIRPFVHNRNIDQIELEPSDEMAMIQSLICKTVQPLVNKLCEQRAYQNRDPMALNQFQLLKAQRDWSKSDAGRKAPQAVKGMVQALYQVLITMAHSMKLLNFHGMSPFFVKVKEFRTSVEETGSKSKTKLQITNSPDFQKMMDYLKLWINNPDFVGHPKLTYLCDTLLNHFMDAGDGRSGPNDPPSTTRSIVFCEYRESAEEICRVLNRHKPMIRASVFVGQADTKTSTGMTQEKQQKTINDFKSGIHNVIVATSIGEEGLDIGQVDLIVCYDASSSPIRMLQRMGRTGRKRAGQIVLLLMKGKEVQNFAKSKDNYEKIQKMICDGSRFNFRDDLSHRIVPRTIKPAVDKRDVVIPIENTQNNSMPEPKKSRARGKKLPPKKFHVPDGVELGFVTGSDFFGSKKSKKLPALKAISELDEEERMPVPPIETVLLSQQDELELERRYQNVQGDDKQEVCYPEFTLHPEAQRQLGVTRKVRHGQATRRLVEMLRNMHDHERSINQTELWRQVHDGVAAKEAPPESFITSSPLTKKMSPPVEELESDGLEVLPPAKSARQPRKKAAPRKKKSRARATLSDGESVDNSADNMISNDEDDDGSDLLDFIADDKVITYDSNASQSPTSSIKTTLDASTSFNKDQQPRPFFEMTQFTQESMNDDDDEMPDISVLVGNGKAETIRKPLQETGVNDHVLVGKAQGARGSKRRIIAEDSDDE